MLMDTNGDTKMLLLKVLCRRLPYGINVKVEGERYFNEVKEPYIKEIRPGDYLFEEDDITIIPYLRPMSTLTTEEKEEMHKLLSPQGTAQYESDGVHTPMNHYGEFYPYEFMWRIIDWLNAHHFDYNGLIEKGLALEAPEGMYK